MKTALRAPARPVIVSGFQPFGGIPYNPSEQVAKRLDGQRIGGALVTGIVLPVVYDEDHSALRPWIERLDPQLILCCGLSPRAACIQLERFAVNLRQSSDSERPVVEILERGTACYMSTIPVDETAAAIRRSGVPAEPHSYAGDYLCNHIFYRVLADCEERDRRCRVGFLHLPHSTEGLLESGQAQRPSLPERLLERAVRSAIRSCLRPSTGRLPAGHSR